MLSPMLIGAKNTIAIILDPGVIRDFTSSFMDLSQKGTDDLQYSFTIRASKTKNILIRVLTVLFLYLNTQVCFSLRSS